MFLWSNEFWDSFSFNFQVFLQVQPPSKEKPNIAAIDDIRELLHLVEVLGASTITGFRSLDEMKSYLMERVKSLTEEHGWIAGEVSMFQDVQVHIV